MPMDEASTTWGTKQFTRSVERAVHSHASVSAKRNMGMLSVSGCKGIKSACAHVAARLRGDAHACTHVNSQACELTGMQSDVRARERPSTRACKRACA
eukprot:3246920-Pleurochrysis_carterae.AAC.2